MKVEGLIPFNVTYREQSLHGSFMTMVGVPLPRRATLTKEQDGQLLVRDRESLQTPVGVGQLRPATLEESVVFGWSARHRLTDLAAAVALQRFLKGSDSQPYKDLYRTFNQNRIMSLHMQVEDHLMEDFEGELIGVRAMLTALIDNTKKAFEGLGKSDAEALASLATDYRLQQMQEWMARPPMSEWQTGSVSLTGFRPLNGGL